MAQWDDSENQGDPFGQTVGGGSDPYARIRAMYQQVTGGQYTPTDADVSQWGTNIDANYASKIFSQIGQWWQQKQAQTPAPKTGESNPGPTPTPTPTPQITTEDINNAPLTRPFDQTFTAPAPVNLGGPAGIPYVPPTPTFTPPKYTPPPAFKFNAPSADDVFNNPDYKWRVKAGENSLQNWAAARGTLNDSSTAKGLEDYGQGSASQEFSNIWNRDWQQQMGEYATNYQTQYADPYQIEYKGATDALAPQLLGYQTQAAAGQHTTDTNYLNSWNEFLNKQNYFTNWQDRVFNKQLAVATA